MGDEPVIVERVETPRGELVLRRVGEHFEVISNGVFLMDSRNGRSERLLVTAALDGHPAPRSVLIGGLGVGYSVVAALADTRVERVTVVEIEQALVDWHDGPLASFSGGLLRDARVEVVVADLADHLAAAPDTYDVVCLDVDNGPDWTVTETNEALYGDAGTRLAIAALHDGGVLSVWSAHGSPAYEQRLRGELADVRVLEVPVARGEPDVIYLGRRRPGG
ncbi:MAG: spermine/spermidine synthase domain-containing protein [Actinomycetes bacterium]